MEINEFDRIYCMHPGQKNALGYKKYKKLASFDKLGNFLRNKEIFDKLGKY